MGVYSTNRIGSVEESIDIDSLDWTPDFSIGSTLEAAIQIHENDARMFTSLIECDFVSAARGGMSFTEAVTVNQAKKNKIKEKIHSIFEAIKNFIQKAASNLIAKIIDLVKADKKIYESYKDVLNISNLRGFTGIRDFAYPAAVSGNELMGNFRGATDKFINAARKAETREQIDNAYEVFNGEAVRLIKQLDAEVSFGFNEKVAAFIPNAAQISEMLGVVKNASNIIKGIKKHTAYIIGELKKLQKESKAAIKSTGEDKEEEVYIAKKIYDVASASGKLFSKEFNTYQRMVSKQIAAFRKATIICGRYAAKYAKGNQPREDISILPNQESAIVQVLGEVSDDYVYECLGY